MSTQPDEGRIYEFGIKDRIRAAREGSGMDQGQLADAAQLARQTVSNYERGMTKPSRGNVRLIAWATGYDYEILCMTATLSAWSRRLTGDIGLGAVEHAPAQVYAFPGGRS